MITLAKHAVATAKTELSRAEGEPCVCLRLWGLGWALCR